MNGKQALLIGVVFIYTATLFGTLYSLAAGIGGGAGAVIISYLRIRKAIEEAKAETIAELVEENPDVHLEAYDPKLFE